MKLSARQQLIAMLGLLLVVLLWASYVHTYHWPLLSGVDNFAYWSAWHDGGLYAPGARLAQATYIYSPAFAQILYPFTLLSWDAFRIIWIATSWVAMVYLLWPLSGPLRWAAILAACYFCLNANADWIVALCVGVGLRLPGVWAVLLLTKVTPGIGIIWFGVRQEWRSLAIALGSTVAVVAVSFAAAPHLWFDWVDTLIRSVPYSTYGSLFGMPVPSLLLRLPLAIVLVLIGARRGWPWVLPTAAFIAQPDIWGVTVLFFASLPRLYESFVPAGHALDEPGAVEPRLSPEGRAAPSSSPAGSR